MRKLASIRRIAEIKPIEGADAIEAVRVDGWWCVSKKIEYKTIMSGVWEPFEMKKTDNRKENE